MPEEKKTPDDPKTPDLKATPDPKALRALAHPLRWQLMEVVGREGTATATRCADVLGESVASCSYHLGILAKYGYIEEFPDRVGREKPWRLASTEQDLGWTGDDLENDLAAEAATEAFLDWELARTKQRLRRRALEPEEWRPKLIGETTWLTEDEYAAVWRELNEVLDRHRRDATLTDPARRPAGSREARLFISVSAGATPASGGQEPSLGAGTPPKQDLPCLPGSVRSATRGSAACSPGRHCPASATALSTSRSGSGPRP